MLGNQIEGQVAQIRRAAADGDLSELAREAHSLAGCTGNAGASRLCRLARELEAACKNGQNQAATDRAHLRLPPASSA